MTAYLTDDGQRIEAANAAAFVRALKASSAAGRGLSDRLFMQQTAQRVAAATGNHVSTRNAKSFLAGLIDAGLVKFAEEQHQ